MKEEKKPIANPMMVLREEFDDWAVLFDPDTTNAFGLDSVSVFIWKCLDGRHTNEDIFKELCTNCDDVPKEAKGHIDDFINSLVEKGLAGYEISKV